MHSPSTAAAVALIIAAPAAADTAFDDLTRAAIRGDTALVEEILATGADPNRVGWLGMTPFTAAMRSCRVTVGIVQAMLAANADVDVRSGPGVTPLMIAWQNGRPDLAAVLEAAGADPTARNAYGDSADEYRDFFRGDLPEEEFPTLRYTSLGDISRDRGPMPTSCDD